MVAPFFNSCGEGSGGESSAQLTAKQAGMPDLEGFSRRFRPGLQISVSVAISSELDRPYPCRRHTKSATRTRR